MKRTFLKNGQFGETKACFLGKNFIGNGHWMIHTKYASNRAKFATEESAQNFVLKGTEVKRVNESIEQLVERKSKDDPLYQCSISDICIGKGVLLEANNEMQAIQAPYANLLKQITGKDDTLMTNNQILIAEDGKGVIGLVISLYDLGDLLTSIRNRNIIKHISTAMNLGK